MKQLFKKELPALVLVVCLIISNITMAFAGVPSENAPSVTQVDTEITSTAEYLKTSASINATSDFYNSSKLLILLLRSGINCSDLLTSYFSEISTSYTVNGELTLTDPLSDYAYLSIILALAGKDATDFNGINIIEKYEAEIINSTQTTLNSVNPYKLTHMYLATYAYAKEFKDSSTCLTKITTAILSYANENGINYWGNSADNNGFSLSGLSMLSSTSSDFNTLVDNAITFSQTLLQLDGTSVGDFQWSTLPNADSTAASLALYSTYGKEILAARSYSALLTFKNTAITGAYSYTDATASASIFATIDALYSLEIYRAILSNQPSPFDVSDKLAAGIVDIVEAPIEDTTVVEIIGTDSTIETVFDKNEISPATSDFNMATLYLYIMIVSSCGLIITVFAKNQNKRKNS